MENPYEAPRADLGEPFRPAGFGTAVSAAITSVSLPLVVLLTAAILPVQLGFHQMPQAQVGSLESAVQIGLSLVVALAQSILLSTFCMSAARSAARGEAPSAPRIAREGFEAWPRVAWAQVVPTLLMSVGFVLCILPGVYAAIRFAFVGAIAFETSQPESASRQASLDATRDRFAAILAILLFFAAPSMLLGTAFVFPDFGVPAVVSDVVLPAAATLFGALSSSALWIYYTDLRGASQPDGRS